MQWHWIYLFHLRLCNLLAYAVFGLWFKDNLNTKCWAACTAREAARLDEMTPGTVELQRLLPHLLTPMPVFSLHAG